MPTLPNNFLNQMIGLCLGLVLLAFTSCQGFDSNFHPNEVAVSQLSSESGANPPAEIFLGEDPKGEIDFQNLPTNPSPEDVSPLPVVVTPGPGVAPLPVIPPKEPPASPAVQGEGWDNQFRPYALSQPKLIKLTSSSPTSKWPAYGASCAGRLHYLKLEDHQDYIIQMAGTKPLSHPLWIVGGRNVRAIGIDIHLQPQPGCAMGLGISKTVGGMALRLEQSGTSFLEGARLEMNQHLADCIVIRNNGVKYQQALATQKVTIQNSSCQGSRGTWIGHPLGDHLHADFIQSQGNPLDPFKEVRLENITQKTTASGAVLSQEGQLVHVRNFEFTRDKRYPLDNRVKVLNPLWINADNMKIEGIYTDFQPLEANGGYMAMSVAHKFPPTYYSYKKQGVIRESPDIHYGRPPQPFAPWGEIGLDYKTPHN